MPHGNARLLHTHTMYCRCDEALLGIHCLGHWDALFWKSQDRESWSTQTPGKPTSLQSAGWAKNNFILTLDVFVCPFICFASFQTNSFLSCPVCYCSSSSCRNLTNLSRRSKARALHGLGESLCSCWALPVVSSFKRNTPMCEHLISQLCFSWWMAKWVEGMNTVNQMQWMIHAPKMFWMMILKTVHIMYSSTTGQEHKPGHSGVVLLLGDICSGSRTSP